MEFNIRSLQKKDSTQVSGLILQLTKNIVDPQNLGVRIRKLALSNNSKFFIAESDGKVVGFGGLAWYVIPSKGLIGWVEEVVVDEHYRGKGIGRALMNKIIHFANSKNIKQLKLTASNEISRNLYLSLGFSKKEQDYLFKNLF
jgi:PhnO protein